MDDANFAGAAGGSMSIDVDKVSEELRIRPQIYIRLITSFASSLSGKMKALNEALESNDTDQMRMILHEIKGTAANLRLQSLLRAEDVMHVAVKGGEAQKQLYKYFADLSAESVKLQQYVNKEFNPDND